MLNEIATIFDSIGKSGNPKEDELLLDAAKSKFEQMFDLKKLEVKNAEREAKIMEKAQRVQPQQQINPLPQ